jgi:hypothetical protein
LLNKIRRLNTLLKKQVVNGKIRIELQVSATKNATWVAKIDGLDSKHDVFQRILLQPKNNRTDNSYVYYDLEDGDIYEISEPYEGVYYITVSDKQIL